jgi:hypothetical protein
VKAKEEYLDSQITKLRAELPPRLALESLADRTKGVGEAHAANWVARQHRHENGLRLTVVSGDAYKHERECSSIKAGEPLHTTKNDRGNLDVLDSDDCLVGRLQNCSPLMYGQFVRAMELCYGDPISLQAVAFDGEETRQGTKYSWLTVRVTSVPNPPPWSSKSVKG